jgi:hypothetical protein
LLLESRQYGQVTEHEQHVVASRLECEHQVGFGISRCGVGWVTGPSEGGLERFSLRRARS